MAHSSLKLRFGRYRSARHGSPATRLHRSLSLLLATPLSMTYVMFSMHHMNPMNAVYAIN